MAINRRQLLQLSATGLLAGLVGCARNEQGLLIGGFRTRDNSFGVAAIDPRGDTKWVSIQPGRLHEIAVNPDAQLVAAVARRPGKFISLLRLENGQALGRIDAPPSLHFEGHALWHNGLLWATAATENGAGRLLGFDLSHGLLPTPAPSRVINLPGLGPHQVLGTGESLIVAIGGWATLGRDVVNAEKFQSSLAWVNLNSGEIRSLDSPEKDLSIRHLATDGKSVWAGMQYARPHATNASLVYQTDGSHWQSLAAPKPGWGIFSGYIGSLAAMEGELLATSPQGHHYGRWDLADGRCIETASVLDVCPAAAGDSQWYMGSGTGEIRSSKTSWHQSDYFWDNHWTYVTDQVRYA